VTPKSGVFLGGSCIAGIAAVGCIFELASGKAQYGMMPTAVILALSVPLGVFLFIAAVKDAKANQEQ
jgi:hypothetical protein